MELKIYEAGKIDIQLFHLICSDITTDEVIITQERIDHIEDHHPGDYQKYGKYIPEMLAFPDAVLRDKHAYTAILIKKFIIENHALRLTLRLHTVNDIYGRKNSILSFQYIRESEYRRLLKQKSCVYKKRGL